MESDKPKNLLGVVWLWVKDLVEVGVTLGVVLIVLRVVFGSHTLVPLVVVTSGSMLHPSESWRSWLTEEQFSYNDVISFPFQNGFARGDMIVTISPTKYLFYPDTRVGDVVVYKRDTAGLHSSFSKEPIIHRVVGIVFVEDWKISEIKGTTACLTKPGIAEHMDYIRSCQTGDGKCHYPEYPINGTFKYLITKGDNNEAPDQCGTAGSIALPVNDRQLIARGLLRLPYIGYIKLAFNAILMILFTILKIIQALII